MDLVFDTTNNGEDVRLHTVKVAKFMEPKSDKTPPIVVFRWGAYKFQGMVENYRETIDFFSANGVPLRASINLTLSSQDKVFEGGSNRQAFSEDETQGLSASPPPGRGISDLASQGGNPDATRGLGQENGIEDLRFPEQDSVELSGSPSLRPPVNFSVGASAGLEVGAGLDLGVGVSGGIKARAGVAAGLSAGAGLSTGAGARVGATMSAGVSASAGAFAGLRTQAKSTSSSTTLKIDNFIDLESTANLGLEADMGFGLGGQAGLNGSASFKADVGKPGELSARIEFDGE
ncbi:MAG: hypothetical protein KJ862_04550 [Proteobacteria bacterium]|nr:hypothetical protein [Pseudomonadota bacterium]